MEADNKPPRFSEGGRFDILSFMDLPLSFRTVECSNPQCRFRIPLLAGKSELSSCPKCGARLEARGAAYPRHRVRKTEAGFGSRSIRVLLDNVRSLYNVGSIFRTAEAVGIRKIHLCGMTATPENPRLAKTALGAEKMVSWEYQPNGVLAAEALRQQGFSLWAIEGGEQSVSLFDVSAPPKNERIVLIIGNELAGIDPEILRLAERILYIPMQGEKESLNLTVAFGVAAYFLRGL
jgi:tRNA G18 (ribose-2'-O)-methylase SpoU